MAAIHDLLAQIQDEALRERLESEINKLSKTKKFGIVFEEHLPECTPLYDIPIKKGSSVAKRSRQIDETYEVAAIKGDMAVCINKITKTVEEIATDELVCVAEFGDPIYPYLKPLDSICNAPDSDLWHTLIEADNYHALQLLEYLYAGKVDCIYIDPPYNTGAKDWKYNNDYVDTNDSYRHSKWLSFMQKRLQIAKKLLNPIDSVLIITIDEKEYLHLGCLLEEMFPEATIQMITDVINPGGTNRENEFSRVEEYLFICRFGNCSIVKKNHNMLGNTDETNKARVWYSFNRGNNLRESANNQFFPIYIDEESNRIVKVGEPMGPNTPISDFPTIDGLSMAFPINDKGNQCIWRGVSSTIREWAEKGYIRVSKYDRKIGRWTMLYIPSGLQSRIESGEIKVKGKKADGSLDIDHIDSSNEMVAPRTVWNQKYHNATDYGASIIKKMLPNRQFLYPKSVYSVKDAISFFVSNKPNALIVDFFAGSGTTLHSVNLINADDGGHRRCIMVTNNEVSEKEAKNLSKKGKQPGSDEWESLGIARYITWPRTVCSIIGKDLSGKPLEGKYIDNNLPMASGFKTNAVFFKLGFLDKTSVALGKQLEELIPVLWMKAGSHHACPNLNAINDPMIVLPDNEFAILINENYYQEFVAEVQKHPEIKTIYIVTDSEAGYREMISEFSDKDTYQLYRDYLDNFRINTGR